MLCQHWWICKSTVIFILFKSQFFNNVLESYQLNKHGINNLVELCFYNEIFLSVELIVLLGINNWKVRVFKYFGKFVLSEIEVMGWNMLSIFIRFKRISFFRWFSSWNFISKVLPIHDPANKFESLFYVLIKFFEEFLFKI